MKNFMKKTISNILILSLTLSAIGFVDIASLLEAKAATEDDVTVYIEFRSLSQPNNDMVFESEPSTSEIDNETYDGKSVGYSDGPSSEYVVTYHTDTNTYDYNENTYSGSSFTFNFPSSNGGEGYIFRGWAMKDDTYATGFSDMYGANINGVSGGDDNYYNFDGYFYKDTSATIDLSCFSDRGGNIATIMFLATYGESPCGVNVYTNYVDGSGDVQQDSSTVYSQSFDTSEDITYYLPSHDMASSYYDNSYNFVGWRAQLIYQDPSIDNLDVYYKPGATMSIEPNLVGNNSMVDMELTPIWLPKEGPTIKAVSESGQLLQELSIAGYGFLANNGYHWSSNEALSSDYVIMPSFGNATYLCTLPDAVESTDPNKEFTGWLCSLDNVVYEASKKCTLSLPLNGLTEYPEVTFTPVYRDIDAPVAEAEQVAKKATILDTIVDAAKSLVAKIYKSVTFGKQTLEKGVAYKLGSGSYKVSGDDTVYSGNQSFYVSGDGDYTFENAAESED